ncbi:MAG: UvrD-helicase domain-containing protein [bacterium]
MAKLTPHQKNALNYNKHISLTANAGSGKTFVLSKRFVEIALNENIPLSKIVAITFTEKAAGELYRRVAGELDERLENENDPSTKIKLEKIRRQLISANISTIHSFCTNVLREFSPPAGIDTNFSPVDQLTSAELIELSIEEYINGKLKSGIDTDNIKYLIRYYGSKSLLAKDLAGLIQKRRNILNYSQKLYSLSNKDAADELEKIFAEKFNSFFSEKIISFLKDARFINSFVISESKPGEKTAAIDKCLANLSGINNPFDFLKELNKLRESLLTKGGGIYKQGYLKDTLRDGNEKIIESIEQFFNEMKFFYIDGNYKEVQLELIRFGKTLLQVFNDVVDLYDEKKRERSYLDFEDLLLQTAKVIESEAVRKALNEKYTFIMIDEYQDTNELQYNIVMPILENLKLGNLFVVGDEKQSIYMFLDAELEVFNRTKREIKKSAGDTGIINLPHSFRVAPEIALFVNNLFKRLFENPVRDFNEVEYSELVCARDESSKGQIEFLITDEYDADNSEAELLAKRIQKLKNDTPEMSFGHIAVLCRKRRSFAELEKEFVNYNIPYSIIGGRGFYQQQVIYDVHNYLSFLINPRNDKALVGILRSPFYTVPDSEILNISLETGNSFYDKLKNYSFKIGNLNSVCKKIEFHRTLANASELGILIRKILTDTGYFSIVASKPDANQHLANINKLKSIANNFSRQHFNTLYDFVDFLEDAIEGVEDEGQASVTVDENAVKIMTIHQAKGLEFPAVFLFRCNDSVRESKVTSKNVSFDKEFGFAAKVPIADDYFNDYRSAPIVNLYNYKMKRKELAEHKRLLYVAITRAINFLFISASHKEYKFTKNSFINLIETGLRIPFEADRYNLSGTLTMMEGEENNFATHKKEIEFNIPILKKLDEIIPATNEDGNTSEVITDINFTQLHDSTKEEIVSATKIAIYSQCPIKYQLIYELGAPVLYQLIKKYTSEYEFHPKEDGGSFTGADVKGRIVHEILEKEIPAADVPEAVKKLLLQEFLVSDGNELDIEKAADGMASDVLKFYDSKTFVELRSYENYKNELEIYSNEKDFFLYGIIDKLVIEDDKLIIIDYKTDNVAAEKIQSKAQYYLPQLKFYSYILTKKYPSINSVELRILFIKHPDNYFHKEFAVEEIRQFGKSIEKTVMEIRANSFKPNYSHCPNCHFADKQNRCVRDAVN